ncbi:MULTISPECIES: hypothetical protein [unclassified Streptomyces]|uniref:hypothetical protein n=1 Tax=unclassified Streptomyces TaxID=2593676 RepID=UPI000823D9A9|nr:hypothetical protein [Streptomyces sp. AmelKG-E11A]SCK20679.1 hypothetical protein YW7DRAFT_01508 [Streptomyces sp. AmelKG-E11A]
MDETPERWTTTVHGQEMELPSTIADVRAALAGEQRAAFDAEIGSTPGPDLPLRLAMWALRTVPGAVEEMDDQVDRLRSGDYSGVTVLDDGEVA